MILNASSNFSPYAPRPAGSPFGATVADQLPVACAVAKAAHLASTEALTLNACYPEFVNTVLRLSGHEFDAGVGNTQLFSAPDRCRISPDTDFLGHHSHLGKDFVREMHIFEWESQTSRALRPPELKHVLHLRGLSRFARNALAARAAGSLIARLVERRSVRTCLPGALGVTGASPVQVDLTATGACVQAQYDPATRTALDHWYAAESLAEGWSISGNGLHLTGAVTDHLDARRGLDLTGSSRTVPLDQLDKWVTTLAA